MINREIISDVRNSLRSANIDEWIPNQFIYSKLKGVTALFIKREADDKRLFRYTELFTTIKCLPMEEVPLIDCCDISIPDCTTVMKSKDPLPEIFSTRFGYLMNVMSLDYGRDYIPTTPKDYKYTQSREFVDPRMRYYWIENGYIIVPKSMVERLTVKAMFCDKAKALRIDSCDGDDSHCIRFLDEEFVAPTHLIQDIKNAVITELSGTYKRFTTDELPNGNSQEKTNPGSL